MRYVFPVLALGFVLGRAEFGPNLRIDHENRATNGCFVAAVTMGPG